MFYSNNIRFFLKIFIISWFFVISFLVQSSNSNISGDQTKQQKQQLSNRVYHLTTGSFRAVEVKLEDKIVDKLIGVTYAKANRAFEKSVIFNSSSSSSPSSIQNADKWPPLCVQATVFNHKYYGNFKLGHKFEMSFDCLTINVYIPVRQQKQSNSKSRTGNNSNNSKMPAMLFIHGGSNAAGTSTYLDGTALACLGDVVVASANYRLDILGFLSVPEMGIKGNYGLWDQLNALKWLHENCENLGCDPKSITLFGHSAGSGDIMLLSQSKLAQPYINRLIMQSGSGLSHWAINYEDHVIHQLKQFLISSNNKKTNGEELMFDLNDRKTLKLIDDLNIRQSKYVSSLNDLMSNFISTTTCNLTEKYECVVNNLRDFLSVNDFSVEAKLIMSDYTFKKEELCLRLAFRDLCRTVNINDILYMMGYINKILLHVLDDKQKFYIWLLSLKHKHEHLFSKLIFESNRMDEDGEKIFSSLIKLDRDEHFQMLDEKDPPLNLELLDPCQSHLYYLVQNAKSLLRICQFVNDFQRTVQIEPSAYFILDQQYTANITETTKPLVASVPYFILSPTVRGFLRCFIAAYMSIPLSDESLLNYLLAYNHSLVLKETVQCLNQVSDSSHRIELKKYKLSQIYDDLNIEGSLPSIMNHSSSSSSLSSGRLLASPAEKQKILNYQTTMRTVYELSMLTENANYLHKPTLDNELIKQSPTDYLNGKNDEKQFDQMIGVTSHESFYFLDHAFNFTDLIKHAFIYSSLLNKTSNLIPKLVDLTHNQLMRSCLKKSLYDFYRINYTKAEIMANLIQRNIQSLEMISDIDFYLPMITQLKSILELECNSNSSRTSKYFIYKYSYRSSFNYMLQELKSYYAIFDSAYKHFNGNVVPHFSELDFVFGLPILSKYDLIDFKDNLTTKYDYTEEEYKLSVQMIHYWTNFAKYGNPTYGRHDNDNNHRWLEFSCKNQKVFNIDSLDPDQEEIDRWFEKHKFWYESLPNEIYDDCRLNFDIDILSKSPSQIKKNIAHILIFMLIIWFFLLI